MDRAGDEQKKDCEERQVHATIVGGVNLRIRNEPLNKPGKESRKSAKERKNKALSPSSNVRLIGKRTSWSTKDPGRKENTQSQKANHPKLSKEFAGAASEKNKQNKDLTRRPSP